MALIFTTKPITLAGPAPETSVSFATVNDIIVHRCIQCHSATPTDDVFKVAPLGITFDSPGDIKANAVAMRYRTIDLKDMPFNNKTQMTDEERNQLQVWIDKGAALD
jgi:uncharacterized membrane protein